MKSVMRNCVAFLLCLSLCFCVFFPSPHISAADESFSSSSVPETVRIKILYDSSYAYFFKKAGFDSTAEIESRLMQLSKLIKVPYLSTYNVNLEFTVQSYESLLGHTYADQYGQDCVWELVTNENGRSEKKWHTSGICECEGLSCANLNAPHHTSARFYLQILNNYMATHDCDFDAVALYVGHPLCTYYNGEEMPCGGLANCPGKALVMQGFDNMWNPDESSNESSLLASLANNFDKCKQYFWHEFGHSLGATHGTYTHTANTPCSQCGGYDGVVYANDIWCSACKDRISFSTVSNDVSMINANSAETDSENMYYVELYVATQHFSTYDEYSEFLAEQQHVSSVQVAEIQQSEQSLPDWYSFEGIDVFDSGSTATYSISGRVLPFSVNEEDTYLAQMLSFSFKRTYSIEEPNFTDPYTYAYNLASSIGVPTTFELSASMNGSSYLIPVRASVKRTDGSYESVVVGHELVYVSKSSKVIAHYFPATVRVDEIKLLCK